MSTSRQTQSTLFITHPELTKEWDYDKNAPLTPEDITAGSNKKVWWRCNKNHSWESTVWNRTNGYGCPYCSGRRVIPGETDLLTKKPELAKEWNYEKNTLFSPQKVASGSGKKVWWKCQYGHEWEAIISSRANGKGCPFCSGRLPIVGKTDLATTNPKLLDEWDYVKNGSLTPEMVSARSDKLVWWKCSICNDSWKSAVKNRTKGCDCPKCKNNKISLKKSRPTTGANDLATLNSQLANDWHPIKNGNLKPDDCYANSGKKVWWKCSYGHEWEATIASRSHGNGCPYCSGRFAIKGINDLATTNPELVKEWNWEKNGTLVPYNVSNGSNKAVWWKCSNGHEWKSKISNRSRDKGCPYCRIINYSEKKNSDSSRPRKLLPGFNDLKTKNPKLASQWNYDKNGKLHPEDFTPGSSKKVWWKCEKGHEWAAVISSRSNGNGCPYCGRQLLLTGYNDLLTVNPGLAKEWDYERNKGLVDGRGNDISTPGKIIAGSEHKVWWRGKCGHVWKTSVSERINGSSCPICAKESTTSFPEQAIFFYMQHYYPDCVNGDVSTIGIELDIYIPSIRVAIEYDGDLWHSSYEKQKSDLRKNNLCKNNDIQLIRIREYGLSELDGCVCFCRENDSSRSLNNAIINVLDFLNCNQDITIDVDRDNPEIQAQYLKNVKENSVADSDFAKEWNWEKNNNLNPEYISKFSSKKYWWKCDYGHEWKAQVSGRSRGYGCPYCSGRFAITGENDLLTLNPKLASQWNYNKNGNLLPENFAPGSNKKVWWKCEKGHEWETAIVSRSSGRGCPYCSNNKLLPGFNDLQTLRPNLLSMWNYEKNINIKPSEILAKSNKRVWWKCNVCGYEWYTSPAAFHNCKMCGVSRRVSNRSKAVICIEQSIIYESASNASKKTGISAPAIRRCCSGKGKTAGGYHWNYVD